MQKHKKPNMKHQDSMLYKGNSNKILQTITMFKTSSNNTKTSIVSYAFNILHTYIYIQYIVMIILSGRVMVNWLFP